MEKKRKTKNVKIKVIVPEAKAFEYKNEAFERDISVAAVIREKLNISIENPKNRTRLTVRRVAPLNLIYELRKIGNNLNQIAKHLNQGNAIDEDIRAEISEIKEQLIKVANHDY